MVLPTQQTEADLLEAFEDGGCRMTLPRREIAAAISRRQGSFSAEELSAQMPSLGRATVYRSLKVLVDSGALCKALMPDGSPRYSLDQARHHHHLVCVWCGKVEEFRHPAVERMLRSMRSHVDVEIVGHRLELYSKCSDCLAKTA